MQRLGQSRSSLIIASILALAIIVAYFYKRHSAPSATMANNQEASLIAEPSTIELGNIVQGGKTTASFLLKNQTHADVEVSEIKTSCDCLFLQSIGSIASQKTKSVSLVVDFAKDPDFVGGLIIEVEGKTRTGKTAFKLLCQIDVVSR